MLINIRKEKAHFHAIPNEFIRKEKFFFWTSYRFFGIVLRRNILFPVSRPTHFFSKKAKKKKKKKKGRGFQMASCSYALFFCNASLDCMSSVGVCVSVTRGASTILRERLLRIPDT